MAIERLSAASDSTTAYLQDISRIPLLTRERELELTRALKDLNAQRRLLVLGSPVAARAVIDWAQLLRGRDMDAGELMPRGNKSAAQIGSMRRRVREAAAYIAQALRRLPPGAAREDKILRRVLALNLSERKVERLGAKVRALAASVRAAHSVEARARVLRSLPMPAKQLLALDDKLADLQKRMDAVKSELVAANLRLVVSIAKKHAGSTMEMIDLIQEGSLGLMKGADKFDVGLGFRFSTYATWWIRQAINRALADKDRAVRVPAHVLERGSKLARMGHRLRHELGREPTVADYAHNMRMSQRKVKQALEALQEPVSLTSPAREGEEEGTFGDGLIDESAEGMPQESLRKILWDEAMARAFSVLNEREAGLLKLRFGIENNGDTATLEECGRILGVTRERARQIEHKALEKLQASPDLRDLH